MGIDVHPVTLIKRGRELREQQLRELEPRLAQAEAALAEQGPAAREAVDQARAAWEAVRGATFEQLKRAQVEVSKHLGAERRRRAGLEGTMRWTSGEGPPQPENLSGVAVLPENVVDGDALPDRALLVEEAAEALRRAQAALVELEEPPARLRVVVAGLRSQNDAAGQQLARLAPAGAPVLEPGLWAKMRDVLARAGSPQDRSPDAPGTAAGAGTPPPPPASSSGGAGAAAAPPSPPGPARPSTPARPRKET